MYNKADVGTLSTRPHTALQRNQTIRGCDELLRLNIFYITAIRRLKFDEKWILTIWKPREGRMEFSIHAPNLLPLSLTRGRNIPGNEIRNSGH